MIVSHKGQLALAAVLDLALQPDGAPLPAKTLAARHGLPPRYLEPVLRALVHDGILKSFRGPRGGYGLACDRKAATANDILRAAGTEEASDVDQPGCPGNEGPAAGMGRAAFYPNCSKRFGRPANDADWAHWSTAF